MAVAFRILAVPGAQLARPSSYSALLPSFGGPLDGALDFYDRILIDVSGPAADPAVDHHDPMFRAILVALARRRVMDCWCLPRVTVPRQTGCFWFFFNRFCEADSECVRKRLGSRTRRHLSR